MRRVVFLLCMELGLVALCAPAVMSPSVLVVYIPNGGVPRGWDRIGFTDSLYVGSTLRDREVSEVLQNRAGQRYRPVPEGERASGSIDDPCSLPAADSP